MSLAPRPKETAFEYERRASQTQNPITGKPYRPVLPCDKRSVRWKTKPTGLPIDPVTMTPNQKATIAAVTADWQKTADISKKSGVSSSVGYHVLRQLQEAGRVEKKAETYWAEWRLI